MGDDTALSEVDGRTRHESAVAETGLPIRFIDQSVDHLPRTLVSFFGALPDEVEPALDGIVAAATVHGEKPIFATTVFCFELFRSRLLIVEYFPKPPATEEAKYDRYRHYIRARYAHLILKWNISSEVQMGLSLEAFLCQMTGQNTEGVADLPRRAW